MNLDICIVVPGMAFNGHTFHKQSLGGSESAGYYMARALAGLGHNVTVFCNTNEVVRDTVDYLPLGLARQYIEYNVHDVCIIQRVPEFLTANINSRFTAFWCHDLAMGRIGPALVGTTWNFDKLFVLSKFMRDQYNEAAGVPEEVLFLTRNGLDLAAVDEVRRSMPKDVKRRLRSMIYAARPERGLDVLLDEIMPRMLKQEPEAQLFITTYDNKVEHLAQFYGKCGESAARLGDRVVNLGSLTKAKLYESYLSAGIYAYPVPSKLIPDFDEISCISLMEAQACGLPVVSSQRGALPEVLGDGAGILVTEPVHTPEYYDAFADACVRYMRDPALHAGASEAGLKMASTLDWKGVAEQWTELFETSIHAKSTDMATLANHFWRRSDIYAAKECLKRLPEDDKKSAVVREKIKKDWGFIDEPFGFRDQYERIGLTHDAAAIDWSPQEPRFKVMAEWLAANQDIHNVLDYGCAHGGYATNLLKALPHLHVTGVDIDLHSIELAGKFAEKLGVSDRWCGVVGDFNRLADPEVEWPVQQYDCVIAQEVLEHVPDPAAVLTALEARVKDGGWVYVTVPYGPWEYASYTKYPYRAHVWEFDSHDLYDLVAPKYKFKEQVQLSMSAMPAGRSPDTDEALGWWVLRYRVTPDTRGKLGKIDMERKLALQSPRQTVSVVIMAGGSTVEETLLWCLRSLEHVADELVIVDCGLSDKAKAVLQMSPFMDGRLKVVPGVDPKTEGFETPRNMGLEHATQDWILWIDTDEKLLQPDKLTKYLKSNIFQGYSIRQHHWAVDTHFDPDLPVRLFRNNGKLRFYGMIHEHPETELNKGPGMTLVIGDAHIIHLGYLIESGREVRFNRNLPMMDADIKKYPTRKIQKHFIMRDKMQMVSQALRLTGGNITPEIIEACKEVIQLYREHFLGQGFFSNTDPIVYYSQAVQVLATTPKHGNMGFDLAFSLAADKVNASLNGASKVRFANTEDALKELTYRVKTLAEPLEKRYW